MTLTALYVHVLSCVERFRVFSAVGNFRPPNGVVLLLVVHS